MFKGGYKLIDFKENNNVLFITITNDDVVTITENAIKVS